MTTSDQTFQELASYEDRPETQRNGAPPEQWPPGRPSVVQALLRNWLLVLLPALILGGAGAALALKRTPTYTAEARLNVGKADTTSPAFGGFVTAAAGLATVYSRAVDAPGVVIPVSRQLHWSRGLVASRLSATPIQDSPIIRVIGTAPSASAAEAVANAGATQLTSYITATNRADPDAARLYSEYQRVAQQKAENDMALLQANKRLNNDPGNPALRSQVEQDSANGNALGLRLTALNGAYVAAESSQASTEVLSPLGDAGSATSNRASKVQTVAGVGVLAGLVIGVALAMWRDNRVTRRRLLA